MDARCFVQGVENKKKETTTVRAIESCCLLSLVVDRIRDHNNYGKEENKFISQERGSQLR